MTETTAKAPKRQRKKPARFCKLSRKDDSIVLVIRQAMPKGDQIDTYTLEGIPSDFGRGLILTKHDGTSYCVNLSGPDSTCDCPGFEHHGHCKHTSSLCALHKAGLL